ncbi:MAG: T9SS type A sorting domain-containing protein, partial [Rubricoccaceae bacterium]|nr:T9SS type A sorting domain-containing protein [Rubricoccaceae bacterium]
LVLLGLALGVSAQAQDLDLLIDDYEDGDLSEYTVVFSGGEDPVLSTTSDTPDGSTFALQVEIDGDDYGGFAGFGRGLPGAPYDATGLDNPYLVFDLSADARTTVEINLQTSPTAESRNALVLPGDGMYTRYALSFDSFFQSQADPVDFSAINAIVFTAIDVSGDGNGGTTETTLRFDNVAIYDGTDVGNDIVLDDFDDGDYPDTEYFYYAGGEFIAVSATDDTPDGSAFAFHGEIDGDDYGAFAGFGRTFEGAPIDASGSAFLNFYLRANGPAVLEVNLQNDPAAPGGLKESRETLRLEDTGGAYRAYSLPLDAFIQTTAEPFDPAAAFNIALTFVQLPGDGDGGTTEFAFDFDALGFGDAFDVVSTEALPPSLAAPVAVYPNPATDRATVQFGLAASADVSVEVLDALGRRVRLVTEGSRAAGPVEAILPTDGLPAGTYLVRVRVGDDVVAAPITIVR